MFTHDPQYARYRSTTSAYTRNNAPSKRPDELDKQSMLRRLRILDKRLNPWERTSRPLFLQLLIEIPLELWIWPYPWPQKVLAVCPKKIGDFVRIFQMELFYQPLNASNWAWWKSQRPFYRHILCLSESTNKGWLQRAKVAMISVE